MKFGHKCLILAVLACGPLATLARQPDQSKPAYPSEVSITVEGDQRIIIANGIPNHVTGKFPGAGNPNTISPQKYSYRVPLYPKVNATPTQYRLQSFGIAVNGVPFDPGAAEWWHQDHNWQYEPLTLAPLYLGTDNSHAHVQPNGAYHYHGVPSALIKIRTDGQRKMVLVGWAADGFPIYNDVAFSDSKTPGGEPKKLKGSYGIKKGTRPSGPGGAYDGTFVADYEYVAGSGDLDECNGLTGPTPEYPERIYHYVLTDNFPYIPRLFRGTPDDSFKRGGPGGRRQGNRLGGAGPNGMTNSADAGGLLSGYHMIPRFAHESMNITPDQQSQIEALETETKEKLAKILTPDQMKTLEETRPPRMGPP